MTARRAGPSQKLALVKSTLSGLLAKYNLDKEFARYEFILHWKDIVGEEIARRTRPECIRNGTLVVAVCSAAWAQELSFNKLMILKKLRSRLSDEEVVRDVSFYVSKDFQ